MYSELSLNKLKWLATILAAVAIVTVPSLAADVTKELAAVPASVTLPTPAGGTVDIPMWGFVEVANASSYICPSAPVPWQIPNLSGLAATDNLTVNVRNCLPGPVSVFIPGQFKPLAPVWVADAAGSSPSNTRTSVSQRVRSLDAEIASGATGAYLWQGLKAGTYLFHSGTNQQFQVQMGLYGTLVVGTYAQAASEALLVYSEIDPTVHTSVAAGTWPAGKSAIDYKPKYFLINGKTFPDTVAIPVNLNTPVLFRFVNAGLQTHVPTLGGGLYMKHLAEDGNLYPVAREEYSVELAALKTIDALLTVPSAGKYALYDRMLRPGMTTYIQAGAVADAPVAADDPSYATAEETLLSGATSVLANDTYTGPGTLIATLVSSTSNGSLTLSPDGTFTYTPNANFNGTDSFTYFATDGTLNSNVATATISVSAAPDAPVAADDAVSVTAGSSVTFAVLTNDSDPDGDALTAVLVAGVTGGSLVQNPDQTFTYTPAAGTLNDSFTYQAQDTSSALSNVATVSITVNTPVNQPPVALDDTAQTKVNTSVVILVIGNDTDSDGTLVAGSVQITVNPNQGGTVVNNGDGTVTYSPKKNFRGTDVFKYTVQDDDGAVSNEATVRVNIVK